MKKTCSWKVLLWLGLVCFATPQVLSSQVPQSTAAKPLDIYFIDVEGGAATLIVTPEKQSLLMDCGWKRPDERDVKRILYVAKQLAGLSQIDYFVLSHFHGDHIGAILELSEQIPIRKFYDHAIMSPTQEYDKELYPDYQKASAGKRQVLKPGDLIPLRSGAVPLKLTCVASDGKVVAKSVGVSAGPNPYCKDAKLQETDTSDNAKSIALLLSFGQFEFLDCGDLTWNVEQELACPENRIGKIDLFMVTHHGVNISNNPALVRALQPRVTVMCNGPHKGGHPATVALLKSIASIQANYQLHRNVETSPEQNTDRAHIANWDENCKGEFVKASVAPDGKSYTVTIGASGTTQKFETQ
jgi:beta-lactamase superfamily II metal-dependent hydrolase